MEPTDEEIADIDSADVIPVSQEKVQKFVVVQCTRQLRDPSLDGGGEQDSLTFEFGKGQSDTGCFWSFHFAGFNALPSGYA